VVRNPATVVGIEPGKRGFRSPIEGSFHPYGLKELKGAEGGIARRLRSHG